MPQYLIQITFKVNFIPLNQQYQLYRYMSLTERKTRHNQGVSTQKTTIFDLLKKKKPNNLFQTVTKSYQNSHLKNSHYDQMDQDENKHQTKNTINYKRTSAKQSQSVTPARILFQRNRISQITDNRQEESIVRENNRKGKSFLSMISPIKIRTSSVLQQKPQNKKLMEPVKRIQKSFDYQRKNVTKTINSFKDKVASLQVLLKKLKHKSRDLALLLNPILDSASTENHSISKQVGQIKNTLKSLDILVGQACQSDSGQAIQKLHHSLQEYLKTLQSQIRRSLLEEKANQLQKLQKQKEIEIEKLRVDLKKAIKDNELLMRKNEKIQNAKQQIKNNSTKQENTQLQQTERVKFKLQQRIDELSRNNEDLENKLKQSLSEIKVLQKQLKNERMLKEDMKTKFAKDIHEVTESKNKQLIEEIMRLKAQFNADLNRINQLHEFKEFQLANKLKQKDEQLAKLNYEKESHKQIQSKIIGEANTVKQENINLKIQIDGLVADMHRMNEELYQHWIALKDIKVLTTRLGSFSHFRLIYQDIGFNDHLFL